MGMYGSLCQIIYRLVRSDPSTAIPLAKCANSNQVSLVLIKIVKTKKNARSRNIVQGWLNEGLSGPSMANLDIRSCWRTSDMPHYIRAIGWA